MRTGSHEYLSGEREGGRQRASHVTLSLSLLTHLSRGIPSVTFISPLPAKWKVFRVICVEGSPMDYSGPHPVRH